VTTAQLEFFRHASPHERSDLSHWRKRLGDKLESLLAEGMSRSVLNYVGPTLPG
jgi:hypothetical protein